MIGFSFAGHPVALPLLEMTVAQTFSICTIWGKNQKGHHSGHPVALPLLEMTVAQTYSQYSPFGGKTKKVIIREEMIDDDIVVVQVFSSLY